ncbi:MAG: hypothetical protein AB1746_00100 [Candidatus Zixiibacteriota bacterium]
MDIPQKAKTELKNIHLKQTGLTLTDHEAEVMAQNLFQLFEAIYQPIPKEWLK